MVANAPVHSFIGSNNYFAPLGSVAISAVDTNVIFTGNLLNGNRVGVSGGVVANNL